MGDLSITDQTGNGAREINLPVSICQVVLGDGREIDERDAKRSHLLTSMAEERLLQQSPVQFTSKQGETNMGDKGKKDKGKREEQKKAQRNPKEKRKLKKEKKK